MRRILTVAALTIVAATFSSSDALAQNLLDDGNLSLATTGSTTSNSAWALSINMPDGSDRSAQFQTGFANAQNTGAGGSEAPGTGTGVWFRSFEGNQGGSGEPLAQAELTQSVVASAGGSYLLEFVAGREVNMTAAEFSVALSSSGTGGSTSVDLLTAAIPDGNLGGAASPNAGGTPFNLLLSGVTAGDTLTVSGLLAGGQDSQIPGGQSGFLDSFSLTAVPEPSSIVLALMTAGGAMALIRRRA